MNPFRFGLSCVVCLALFSAGCRPQENAPKSRSLSTEHPKWPHASSERMSVCRLLQTSDYVVQVTPKSIGVPLQAELSPWPAQPMWLTPVNWTVLKTVATRPLPGVQLPALGSSISTVIAAEFTDANSTRIIGVSRIDNYLVTGVFSGYVSGPNGFGAELDPTDFPTETAILSEFAAAAASPSCSRVDVLGPTKVANEARVSAQAKKAP